MTTATLTKWGNGQGILIPKSLCDGFGWKVGDKIAIIPGEDNTLSLSIHDKTACRIGALKGSNINIDMNEDAALDKEIASMFGV